MNDSHFVQSKARVRHRLLKWYKLQNTKLPWRENFNATNDPYHVLVSEIMLQQTLRSVVIPAYERFCRKYPTIESLAQSCEDDIRLASRGLGYYRRFANLRKTAQIITKSGKWPNTYNEWRKLPGIGDYTASAITSIVFAQPNFVVDGNVERIMARMYDIHSPITASLKREFKSIGSELISKKSPGDFNQGFMELGQLVCIKGKPKCEQCPFSEWCLGLKRQTAANLPVKKPPEKKIMVSMQLFIPWWHNQVGLITRPDNAKFLKNTKGFVTRLLEGKQVTFDGDVFAETKRLKYNRESYIGSFSHNITKHKISVEVFHIKTNAKHFCQSKVAFAQAESQLLSNLDRKAWRLFEKNQLSRLASATKVLNP